MSSMPRPRPPNLHREVTRHGKTVWYVRAGKGPRIRLEAEYGTEAFNAEYRAAIAGETPVKPGKAAKGSLEWLWMLYRQSASWAALSSATRGQRDNIMSHVLKASGKQPLSKVNRKSILAARDKRAGTPSQAKNFISTLRGLFTWAVELELVSADPTQGVKRLKKSRPSSGFPVWTDDDIAAFERRWPRGTRERVMFDVFLYTGLRRGDAARLGKQHFKDGCVVLDTEKTGMRVTIPMMPELVATLEAGPVGDLAIIATIGGNPLEKESLGNLFREACRAAGIRKSAHGLRKAAATNMANRGATVAELEAIFGWAGGQMASLYTKSANRKALSIGAASKLSRTETETSIPAPMGQVRATAAKDQSKQS